MSNRYLTQHLRGENTPEYRACRTLRHAWDPIGAGDRRPEWGTMVCLRCIRCGTLRYDRLSRLTGERIGAPSYVWPEGYRDAEGHDMSWWRQGWAEDMYVKGMTLEADEVAQKRGRKRRIMSDPLKSFEDLNYPGRRKPVNRNPPPPERETPVWDAKHTEYVVNGFKVQFFYIGALAKALGYSVQSIRAWEAAGLMPNTPFRSPRTARPVAGGRSNKGKRLWTREQIEGILRLAKKHEVILTKMPPTPAFAADVARLFNELASDHTK